MKLMDAYILSKLINGMEVNGELASVSDAFRPLADHLASLPSAEARKAAFTAATFAPGLDRDAIIKAVADVDSTGPSPDEPAECCATLADVRRLVADTDWPWPGWLAAGVLNGLAADPGTGKTILASDLARRLWSALPWPDGQPNKLPERTPTLWVPGDRHFGQLLALASAYGLPDEAMRFNASATDPTAGLDLDDPAERAALEARIRAESPGLVIVDTVGMTTGKNLCKPEDARDYFGPLMDIAHTTRVPFLLLTHLSRDGQALGRRINGACRLVWKLTDPDPEGQPNRRRLSVDKTYMEKPPALGMTIASAGCSFDFNPPSEPAPDARKPGPPPVKLEACKAWLTDRLGTPDRVCDIRTEAGKAGHSADTLYKAKNALGIEEYELERRKWWKLPSAEEDESSPS